MCDPATIAYASMAITSVGSAFSGYQGAKANAEMQQQMYNQNKENALASMRQEYMTTQQRQAQEMEAASQAIQDRRMEEAKQISTGVVASGESGVSGFSVERILQDMSAISSRDVSTIEQNRDWNVAQLGNQLTGIRNQTISRIGSVSQGVKPSPLPYLIQGVEGVANAVSGAYSKGGFK